MQATAIHLFSFMSMSYAFRYRRVGPIPVFIMALAYTQAFEHINNILYKLNIDRAILNEATILGLE